MEKQMKMWDFQAAFSFVVWAFKAVVFITLSRDNFIFHSVCLTDLVELNQNLIFGFIITTKQNL